MSNRTVNVTTGEITENESYVAPSFQAPIEVRRSRASLERADFAIAAATAGHITFPEGEDWAAGNSLPATVVTAIEGLPPERQGPARIIARSKQIIERNGELIPVIAAAFGIDDAGVDALFGL